MKFSKVKSIPGRKIKRINPLVPFALKSLFIDTFVA